ncbi:TPA: hypothetical protein I7730_00290 [Vibrio vulnificus]|uniref:Uncharacterized protein n=1 Tax=Vibrio vulnificus TaxID=672 RepID=A0A8H9K6N2_VIBVL|nr:hypothetical protein [Vibrio vulnificus]
MNVDPHSKLFTALTHLVFVDNPPREETGYVRLSPEEECDLCKRKIHQQNNSFNGLGKVGLNTYKQKETMCLSCAAFFENNPTIMGVEKSSAPTTGQKWGMLTGSGVYIDLKAMKTVLFMPPKSAEKLPDLFHEHLEKRGIKLVITSQYEQISKIVELGLGCPAIWVNNFGRKTHQLVANLDWVTSHEELLMVNDDDVNSATKSNYVVNISAIKKLADKLKLMTGKSKFLKMVRDAANGHVGPYELLNFVSECKERESAFSLLPSDPHLQLNYLQLASKI